MSKKIKKTSPGLMEFMKRKGLDSTGDSKTDMKTCRDKGLFPNWSDRNEQSN